MVQIPQPTNNQNENKNNTPPAALPIQPISQNPFISDSALKSPINANGENNGRQFKLASAEVQGPKLPLAAAKGPKFALIAIVAILIIIAGLGAYYFYTKTNNSAGYPFGPEITPSITPAVNTVDKNPDSDQDGLPDYMEKILGTDPNNPDTDGDGYNDLQELKSGYSPLIAGAAGKYTPEQWQAVKDKIKAADAEFHEREFGSPVISQGPSPVITPTTIPIPISFICGATTVKDIDNNIYKTVKIGAQCWLKENLKVTKNPKGVAITRYCYNNDPKICETDGGLYDWNTAMNGSTTEGAQGICPNGWHVPKDSDWYVLENGLKDNGQVCDAIRSDYGCDSSGTKLKVGGSSGFEGITSGTRSPNGQFVLKDMVTQLWSSTKKDNTTVWNRRLIFSNSLISRSASVKEASFSVRCLKD